MVTLYPRFIVKNQLDEEIQFREVGSDTAVTLAADERRPLEFLRAGMQPQLVLSFPGSKEW